MKKRIFGKITAALLAVLLVMQMGAAVYAESYYDGRDGNISLRLPDGWEFEEVSAPDDAAAYEKISEAFDASGETALHFDLYFSQGEVADTEYFYIDGDEADALLYYAQYGMEAIEDFYGSQPDVGGFTVSEPQFWDGEWNSFLVVQVTGDMEPAGGGQIYDFSDTIYLTCRMANAENIVTHNLLVFYNEDRTPITGAAADTARMIADEFYDYGYGDVMSGVPGMEYSDEWGADDVDPIEIIGMIAPVLISLAVVVIAVMKRKAAKKKAAGLPEMKLSNAAGNQTHYRRVQAKPAADNAKEHDHVRDILRRNQKGGQERIQPAEAGGRFMDSESRYLQSLETLQKSGLLTKEEMREMVQRHERSFNRRK